MRSPDKSCENDSGMSFWDHLDVLRGLLVRAVILLIALAALLFAVMPKIFDRVLLAPCHNDFPVYRWVGLDFISGAGDGASGEAVKLININLSSQFMLHLSTSFWLAFIISLPVLIFMMWRFVTPGLYPNEKRPAGVALVFGGVMFLCGVAMSYFIVFPLTLRFLACYQLSPSIPNVISIDSYMDTLVGLSIVMGLVFELPMAAWLLGRMGVMSRSVMTRYRRHAIVALLILAAIITPTGDPVTLCVVFVPLYMLWEFSALLLPRSALAAL